MQKEKDQFTANTSWILALEGKGYRGTSGSSFAGD